MSYIVIESPIKEGYKSLSMTGSVNYQQYYIEKTSSKNYWKQYNLKILDKSKSSKGKKVIVGKFAKVQDVVSHLQTKKIYIWAPFGLWPSFGEITYLHYPDELKTEVKAAKQFFYKIEEIK